MNKRTFLIATNLLRIFLVISLLVTATSCNYFETTKVDSETLYKQEIETISWDEVDQYPLFLACDETADKQQQRQCFKQELSKTLLENLSNKQLQVFEPILDTIRLGLDISNKGELTIARMEIDSTVRLRFPDMRVWLQEGIDKTSAIEPALKRGIPVNTSMTLPIILRSKQD